MRGILKSATVLVVLAATSTISLAQDTGFEPIPSEVTVFLQRLFEDVPAPSVAASIPKTTCRKDVADVPFEGVGGAKVIGAYFCKIDFGCGEVGGAPCGLMPTILCGLAQIAPTV